jgi:kynurenine formamidase
MHFVKMAPVALLLFFSGSVIPDDAPSLSPAQFEQLFESVKNWGRWGNEDQLGTVNFISEKQVKESAQLVTLGVRVSLADNLNKVKDINNRNFLSLPWPKLAGPFVQETFSFPTENSDVHGALDRFEIFHHGFAHSHLDGLAHFSWKGKIYNGYPLEIIDEELTKLGIEQMGQKGIVSRGVLVDFPRLKKVEYLEPGQLITLDDFKLWEEETGIVLQEGDVLLVRTGRWKAVGALEEWQFSTLSAGLHPNLVSLFHERKIAVVGCDGVSDRNPSIAEGIPDPFHILSLVAMGMPLLDNLNLEELSEVAQQTGRHTFMFTGAPLRAKGASGSPLNPIAVF